MANTEIHGVVLISLVALQVKHTIMPVPKELYSAHLKVGVCGRRNIRAQK